MKQQYWIIKASSTAELRSLVETALENGWSLAGGVSAVFDVNANPRYCLHQAMTRAIEERILGK
mgnify:FL=1